MIFWVMFDYSGAKKFWDKVGQVDLKDAKAATKIRKDGMVKFKEMLLAKKWKKSKNFNGMNKIFAGWFKTNVTPYLK